METAFYFLISLWQGIDLFLLTSESITISTEPVSVLENKKSHQMWGGFKLKHAKGTEGGGKEWEWAAGMIEKMYVGNERGCVRGVLIRIKWRWSIWLVVSHEWSRENKAIWDTNESWHRCCSFNNGWFKGFLKGFFFSSPVNLVLAGLIRYRWAGSVDLLPVSFHRNKDVILWQLTCWDPKTMTRIISLYWACACRFLCFCVCVFLWQRRKSVHHGPRPGPCPCTVCLL